MADQHEEYDGPSISDILRDQPELSEESARAVEAQYRAVYDRLRAERTTDGES